MLDVKVVFSSFRNPELEKRIIDQGGQVKTAVSNQTTHVVVKDFSKETASVKKARELGKQVVTAESFIKQYFEKETKASSPKAKASPKASSPKPSSSKTSPPPRPSNIKAKYYYFSASGEYEEFENQYDDEKPSEFKPSIQKARQYLKTDFNHGDILDYYDTIMSLVTFFVYKKGSTIKLIKDQGEERDIFVPIEISRELKDAVSYYSEVVKEVSDQFAIPLMPHDVSIQNIPDFPATFKNKCTFVAYMAKTGNDLIYASDEEEDDEFDFILSITYQDETIDFAYKKSNLISGMKITNEFKKLRDKKQQPQRIDLYANICIDHQPKYKHMIGIPRLKKIVQGTQWQIKSAGVIYGPPAEREKINARIRDNVPTWII